MVLIVKTDVVGEPVQRSVVRESLGNRNAVLGILLGGCDGLVDVVLCDEVARQGVEASSEEGRKEEVENGVPGGEVEESKVECKLDGNVEVVNVGQGNTVDSHRSEGVEEDLESAEESFAENRIEDEGFESGWEIGIEAINAKGLVVRQMVRLKAVSTLISSRS